MDYKKYITIEPDKLGGKTMYPWYADHGLRHPGVFASGMSIEDILKDFPELMEEDIRTSGVWLALGKCRYGKHSRTLSRS